MSHKYWIVLAGIIIIPVMVAAGLWLWVLATPDPLSNPVATSFPWPIACSTRGCITTTVWHTHLAARQAFLTLTKQPAPTSTEALQTLVRHHLSANAQARSPVTLADARRYREEILNVKNDQAVMTATGLTLAAYDEQVVLPFLQQEALRQQRKVESIEELYIQLAQDRIIVILPFGIGWDKTKAVVTTN